jgi:CubicO group peptidase (beta-lactamase class C family)
MKKFMVLYRSTLSNQEQMKSAKPGQAAAIMDEWASWVKEHGAALVDIGAPLGDSALIKGTPGQGHPPASQGTWTRPFAFYAHGFEGQFLVVVPEKKLVVVRMGQTPDQSILDVPKMVFEIASALDASGEP